MSSRNFFSAIGQNLNTPYKVQKFIHTWKYNKKDTIYSAKKSYLRQSAHCLEASLFAAAVLEHHKLPPLVLSIASVDGLDHVLFVFKTKAYWGSIGISRDEGLFGRRPIFKTIKALVDSYADPYVDKTGRIIGYALADLDQTGTDWRFSNRNLWKLERYLIEIKHSQFHMGVKRYKKALETFHSSGHRRKPYWW
jgi:hypothetical protein